MAKRALTVTRFDGGLNCFSDARDIQDNEFFQSWNAVVDRAGILRMAGEGHSYISGLPHLQGYSSSSTNYIQPGWGLFSFGSDATLMSTGMDTNFDTGIERGTVAGAASDSLTVTLATTASSTTVANYQTANYFTNRTIMFYEGSGSGKYIIGTRYIEVYAYNSGTPSYTVTLNSKITVTSTTKYEIFPWTASGGFGVSPWSIPEYYKASVETPNGTFNADSAVGSNIITISSHGYEHFDQVLYKNGGTAVGGLVDGGVYTIHKIDGNTFKLYKDKATLAADILASSTSNCLTLTDGGNENHFLRHWPQADIDFYQNNFLTFGESGYNTPVIAAEAMDVDETALTITTGGVNLLGLTTDNSGNFPSDVYIKLIHLSDSEAVNSEIMGVTSISGDVLTITRSRLGTTAYAHSNGAELIILRYSEEDSNNISANTGAFDIIKNRGKYLGRLTYGRGSTTLPAELLNNTADFSSNWTETGDFALASTKATYTHSTGAATLTQAHGSRDSAGTVSTLYKFSYEIRGLLTDTDRAQGVTTFKILGRADGAETLAARDVHLPLSSGYHEVYFYSQATTAEANFTLSVASTSTGTFVLRKASIRPVDNSGLTLIPGKSYRLSIKASYSRPYMNSVSDVRNGLGSSEINESYCDRLPHVLLYNDTVTDGNSTGLYLQAYNDSHVWSKGQGHTHNILESSPESMNLINNGDFEDGTISANVFVDGTGVNGEDKGWTAVTSSGTSSLSLLAGTSEFSFNAKKAIVMRHHETLDANGERQDYIYQDVTLNSNCYYALTFVYASEAGLQYSFNNTTDSTWLTTGVSTTDNDSKWKSLDRTNGPLSSGASHVWSFPPPSILDSFEDNDKNQLSYIYLLTPEKSDGSDITVRIKFAAKNSDYDTYLSNVSLYKAWPDLLTMSKGNPAPNKFIETSSPLYEYGLSFTVPEEYSESSSWTLAFDGGMYTNPNIESSPTTTNLGIKYEYNTETNNFSYFRKTLTNKSFDSQVITIDDVSIISEGSELDDNVESSENIILSSDNTSSSSNIHAYSENGSNWKKNIIEWNGLNSRPFFIKVREALRVCDTNFDNSNPTALFYYQNIPMYNQTNATRWSTDYEIIQNPPTLNALQSGQAAYINNKFNARNYIEEYFKDLTYRGNFTSSHKRTNWENDRISNRGIVMSYIRPTPSARGGGGTSRITNRENRQYSTFAGGELVGTQWRTNGNSTQSRRNPINFIIRGENAVNNVNPTLYASSDQGKINYGRQKGMQQHLVDTNHVNGLKFNDSTITDKAERLRVAKIEMTLRYDAQFARQYSGKIADSPWTDQHSPYFEVKAGKLTDQPSGIHNEEYKQDFCNNFFGGSGANIDVESWSIDNNLLSASKRNADETENWNTSSWWPTGSVQNNGSVATEKYWRKAEHSFPAVIDLTSQEIYSDDDIILRTEVFHENFSSVNTYMNYLINWDSLWYYVWNADDDDKTISSVSGWYGNINKDDWAGPLDYDGDKQGVSSEVNKNWDDATDNSKLFDFARYERIIYPSIYVWFYNNSWNPANDGQTSSQESETTCNFNFETETDIEPTGWASNAFKLAVSTVNEFDEESHLSIADDEIGIDDSGDTTIPEGSSPKLDIYVGSELYKNEKIKKLKYYMKDTDSDIWYLQFWVDLKKNKAYASTSNKEDKGNIDYVNKCTHYYITNKYMANFNEVDSYESETLVPAEVAEKGREELICRYKSAVVANDRLYVGNVKYGDKIFGDRMIKSPPHKYNILPITNYIDVVINDGDEITALAYYKNSILQFKRRKVFVIDISGEYEFLAQTFDNVGINQPSQVTNTKYGIIWVNSNGCYLFDGKTLTNLIEKKIANSEDMATINYNWWSIKTDQNAPPCIQYQEKRDSLLIANSSDHGGHGGIIDGFHYHFPTKSWSFIFKRMIGTDLDRGGYLSNFVLNQDGNILYSSFRANNKSNIFKWNDGPSANNAASTASNVLGSLYFTTRDFDFGDASLRKKIYKVYVTYKTDDSQDSGVTIKAAVNGTGSFDSTFKDTSRFAGTRTVCYGSSTLDETDGKWKMAELKFSSPSEVNNIYSFQLQIQATNGTAHQSFEINDISIIYKYKKVK